MVMELAKQLMKKEKVMKVKSVKPQAAEQERIAGSIDVCRQSFS